MGLDVKIDTSQPIAQLRDSGFDKLSMPSLAGGRLGAGVQLPVGVGEDALSRLPMGTNASSLSERDLTNLLQQQGVIPSMSTGSSDVAATQHSPAHQQSSDGPAHSNAAEVTASGGKELQPEPSNVANKLAQKFENKVYQGINASLAAGVTTPTTKMLSAAAGRIIRFITRS